MTNSVRLLSLPSRPKAWFGLLAGAGALAAIAACSTVDTATADASAPIDASAPVDARSEPVDAPAPIDANVGADASPDAGPADANTDAATDANTCSAAPSPGRGVVSTLYGGAGTTPVKAVGVLCGKLYLGSDVGTGARPWEGGSLRRCDITGCAATLSTVASFDLHAPARFSASVDGLLAYGRSQPFSLQTGTLDTPGDVLEIRGDGTVSNKGPLLDPAEGLSASFDHLIRRGTTLVLDRRTYHNTGNHRGVVVVRDVGGARVMTEVAPGSQVAGVLAAATPTRIFALGEGLGTGAQLVDLASGSASVFYAGAFRRGFLRGERVAGVGWDRVGGAPNTQVLCESDASCASPSILPNAALPDTGYLGVFGGELVWQVPAAAGGSVSLATCPVSSWGTAVCTPTTLAASVPTPDGDVQFDGRSLYYPSGGQVIRVGL